MADAEMKTAEVPAGLAKRHKALAMEDGTIVVVERWSISKMLYVFEFLATMFEGVTDEELEKLSGNAYTVACRLLKLVGNKATSLLKLCVAEADQDKVTEHMAADDAMEILVTSIQLNMTDKLRKKAEELRGLFAPPSAAKK